MNVIKLIKKIQLLVLIAIVGLTSVTFTSCRKEGCTDPNANNYHDKAKKDDGTCTYPIINVATTGTSGDIKGAGGTSSKTFTFVNESTTAGWDMSVDSPSGTFQLILKDATGLIVLDKTLTGGTGPQAASGTSLAGTSGTWTAIVNLNKFNGSGDYSFR